MENGELADVWQESVQIGPKARFSATRGRRLGWRRGL